MKVFIKKILLLSFLICTGIALIITYQQSGHCYVEDYISSQDYIAVKLMFEDSWANLAFDNSKEATLYLDDMLHDDSKIFKVMKKYNKTIGFAAYYSPRKSSWWHIQMLIVDKKHRNNGYATQMLQYGINDMRTQGADKITICVFPANIIARHLYEDKFSFINEEDPGHYKNIQLILRLNKKI